jgi:cobyrinic acid a,c-diamide synthase
LGLVPPQEHDERTAAIEQAAAVAEQYVDLAAIESLARQAPALEFPDAVPPPPTEVRRPSKAVASKPSTALEGRRTPIG